MRPPSRSVHGIICLIAIRINCPIAVAVPAYLDRVTQSISLLARHDAPDVFSAVPEILLANGIGLIFSSKSPPMDDQNSKASRHGIDDKILQPGVAGRQRDLA